MVIDGRASDSFNVERELRQHDPTSPILFNLVLEEIIRRSVLFRTGTIYRQKQQLLVYADDIVIVARTSKELRTCFISLEKDTKTVGLKINDESRGG